MRKTKHQKRAERIKRVAGTLTLEEITGLSEKEARRLHHRRVKWWFSGQNLSPAVLGAR